MTKIYRNLNIYCIIYISFLFLSNSLFAQINTLPFDNFTRDHGLASNRINVIYEDSKGFIWFGTKSGLNRYTGYGFDLYEHIANDSTTIISSDVRCVIEELSTGNLWIGTDKGLSYFDSSVKRFTNYEQTKGVSINALKYDANNILWMATSQGLFKLNTDKTIKKYTHNEVDIKSIANNVVWSIEIEDDNLLWIGTDNGLDLFDKSKEVFHHHTKTPNLKNIISLHKDYKNQLWVSSDLFGLYLMKENSFNKEMTLYSKENGFLLNNRIYGIVEDSYNNLYLADRDGGLVHLNTKQNSSTFYIPDLYDSKSISNKALMTIALTSKNMLLVGTYNGGVSYTDFNKTRFEHYKFNYKDDGIFNNKIRSLFQDSEGYIWIGTKEDGGLSRFNRKEGTFKNYKTINNDPHSLQDEYVFSINELDNSRLLVGTFKKGLAIFDKKTERFKHFMMDKNNPKAIVSNRVYAIHKDKAGTVWIGTSKSAKESGVLSIFNPKTNTFKTVDGIEMVRCFCDENDDFLWMGTMGHGLHLYNIKTNQSKQFLPNPDDSTSISSNRISGLAKSKKGDLWIATDGGGLCLMDKNTRACKVFDTGNYLPTDRILGIQIDNNEKVWLSTDVGIIQFKPSNYEVVLYDPSDGLQGKEFATYVSLKTKEGEIIFGGNNGFNIFDPNNISKNTIKPDVVITDFKLFNKSVPIGAEDSPLQKVISHTDKIVLTHKQSVIKFEFIALNFTSPEKNNYAYMLEGFDENWIYIGNKREVGYTNLPAGEYVFRVKASNNDNLWNEEGTSIKVIVKAAWFNTWTFRVVVLIIIAFMVFVFFKLRTRRLKENQRILEQKVEEAINTVKQRNEKLEEARQRNASIISDVKNKIGQASVELLEATSSQASTIEEISASIKQMTSDINNNAHNADLMYNNAHTVKNDTEVSVEIVKKTVGSIEKIVKGLDYISEFSRTTNLLSLNASVEAAKAGYHGKSFAVVANEVKKLADQSHHITGNIKKESKSGIELSREANDKISDLQSFINETVDAIAQIRHSSKEQSFEATNINEAIQQISVYVNQTAQLAERLDHAIKTLSSDIEKHDE